MAAMLALYMLPLAHEGATCAGSEWNVGASAPGPDRRHDPTIVDVRKILDARGRRVGWVYSTSPGPLFVQAEELMTDADRDAVHAYVIPSNGNSGDRLDRDRPTYSAIVPVYKFPWPDLHVAPCTEDEWSHEPGYVPREMRHLTDGRPPVEFCGEAKGDEKTAFDCAYDARLLVHRLPSEMGPRRLTELASIEAFYGEAADTNARLGNRKKAVQQYLAAKAAGEQLPGEASSLGDENSPFFLQIMGHVGRDIQRINTALKRLSATAGNAGKN